MIYNDKQSPDTPHRSPLSPLDTLSDAAIFLDQTATILSANEKVAAITGIDKHALTGRLLWQAVPQLITTTFYVAVNHAIHTHTPFQMEYRSPITQTWLHTYLSPTSQGAALLFHEEAEPITSRDIIHRNQEGRLDFVKNLPEWIAILTPEGLLLEINQRPLTETGVQREAVIGQPFAQFPAWTATQEQLHDAIAQASQGAIVRFDAKACPPASKSQDMAVTLTPHLNEHKQVEYLVFSSRDITERKQTEEGLRTLLDTIPQLVWTARADGYLTYNNKRLIDYMGMPLEEIKGDGWLTRVHPKDLQRVRHKWRTAIRTEGPYEVEHRLQNGPNGPYRWFLVRGMPRRDAEGNIQSWIGTCTDIDEQKKARERIKASEQNFRILAETMPHLVCTLNPDGSIDYTNQRYQQYRNLADINIESLWERWYQFIHPDDIGRTLSRRHEAFKAGKVYENEYRLMSSQTGEYHWFLIRGYPMRDEAGQIIKWFVTATDIDEQKRTEEALRQSQRQVQALMASNIIGIFIAEERQILEANDTFLRMTGYNREDLQQGRMNMWDMTAPEHVALSQQAHDKLILHKYLSPFEKEYIGKDGSHLPVLVGGVVLQKDPLQTIHFVLDNSARKTLEQRKDTFINMASHELKTPLTVLKMQIQLLKRRLEKQGHPQAITTFLKVEEPIQRLERLIGELLDVSKMQAGKLEFMQEPVDLSVLLREAAETMQQIHTTHTIVVPEMAPTTIMGDKGRLEQVLFNLIGNAVKFSPNARTIELALSSTSEAATIEVRDYGAGIPQEQHERIFERFYRGTDTQKATIPGLGMGLYIVEEIVKQHHGTITLKSEVGKGSTFQVTLPLKREP